MAAVQILVVEDDEIVARIVEATLEGLGYAVCGVVSSGEEAIKKAREVPPDLVLMDIHLEGDMDGVQTAEEIRAKFDIPVVYLTGYTDNETLQRAKVTEPYGYILKPFQERDLHIVIEIALNQHKIESELKKSRAGFHNIVEMSADRYLFSIHRSTVVLLTPQYLATAPVVIYSGHQSPISFPKIFLPTLDTAANQMF